MSYNSLEEIVRECQEKDLPFDEVILLDDMNETTVRCSREAVLWAAPERRCARMSRAGTRSADRLSEKLWHLHLRWVSQTPA